MSKGMWGHSVWNMNTKKLPENSRKKICSEIPKRSPVYEEQNLLPSGFPYKVVQLHNNFFVCEAFVDTKPGVL